MLSVFKSIVCIAWALFPPASAPSSQPAADSLSALLTPIRKQHNVPALAGAIVEGRKLVASGAVGKRRVGGPEKVTVADKFHIGSCTKSMTATLIALLIEDGRLNWTTTIGDVFPERADKMHADFRGVTLRQLLAHRGGVPTDLSADGLWGKLWEHTGTPTEQRLALLDGVTTKPPIHKPGTKYLYANAGFAIAGAMAERITGESWEDLMKKRIFTPLDMDSAGFGAPGTKAVIDQPRGHTDGLLGRTAVEPGKHADNPAAIGPGGTVHCSIGDWAKYISLHFTGEGPHGRMLKPEMLRTLHKPAKGEDYICGWSVTTRPWGGTVLTHSGSNTMWFCVVWISPEKNFAVLAACNCAGDDARNACDDAAAAMIGHYLKKKAK